MTSKRRSVYKAILLIAGTVVLLAGARLRADTGTCGGVSVTLPFNDVAANNIFFCAIAEAYFSGLTNGTSATTYSPAQNVPREQMAAFITRTMDQSLKRGSRRAALNQWTIPTSVPSTGRTAVGNNPQGVACDGADLWVASKDSGNVYRVRASDGKLLEVWTGAEDALGVIVARGRVFVTGFRNPGRLYAIDPTQPAGPVTTLRDDLEPFSHGLAFAGYYIWVANNDSMSRVDPNTGDLTTFLLDHVIQGMIHDGSNIWITDGSHSSLKKVNSNGSIARSIAVGLNPRDPVFDGLNIWVPSLDSSSVTVVRVKDVQGNSLTDPFVLATLTGNGLDSPRTAAFDGERILVTNRDGDSVSLWKAADLSPIGSAGGVTEPRGVCSDGLNFWITVAGIPGKLARF
jgi:hypothetical protein